MQEIKKILGKNLIGQEELSLISKFLPIKLPSELPPVPYSNNFLTECRDNFVLIFGPSHTNNNKPLTINFLREHFGIDPEKSEPCMYNQDWYLKESFSARTTMENKWYLIGKNILEETRGVQPVDITKSFSKEETLPTAILTAFTFFAYFLLNNGEILWKSDFVWCSDVDINGDQIYTGRYVDASGKNKNGFNIHRHLSIRKVYGAVKQY